jgi:hypothetical protein
MALTNTTQFANRYGLNIEFYKSTDTEMATKLLTVDFANVSDIDITGEITWATGGQGHVNKIGFNDPIQGTFKISTQLMTTELLNLVAGNDVSDSATTGEVVFKNSTHSMPKYYIIKAETVWQDKDGNVYTESMKFHKACPKRAFNISYSGEGDPTSVDLEFELMQDDDGNVLTITKGDQAAGN